MPAYPRRLNARIHAPTKCPRQFAVATVSEIGPSSVATRQPPRGEALKGTRLSQYSPVAARRRTPMSFRALVEKSPAGETKTNVHNNPKYSPAVAHRRAGHLTRGGSPPPEQKTSPRKERFSGVCNISFSRFYLILPFFILPHVAAPGKYARSDLAAAINNYRTFAERTPAGARTRDRLPEPTSPYARNRS